jgi:CubicO group peptidase (beta-lactamase class C family)
MQNGFAFDLDKSILRYFEEYEIANVDARKKNITLRHMLNMRAGFDWDESSTAYNDAENAFLLMTLSDDWVK